jgi:hypothetical protein
VIKRSEADDLISKWVSEGTRLRVDWRAPDTNFSVEGTLDSAGEGAVCVRLRDTGFMEISLDASWKFEYFDPNSTHIPLDGRVGKDHAGNTQETAAGIVGYSQPHTLLLLEIVE